MVCESLDQSHLKLPSAEDTVILHRNEWRKRPAAESTYADNVTVRQAKVERKSTRNKTEFAGAL